MQTAYKLSTKLRTRSVTKNIQAMLPFFISNRIKTVLDYGAGTLRNTCYLLKKGFKVYIAETDIQLSKIGNYQETPYIEGYYEINELSKKSLGVDLVISNFVLNIIDDKIEKEKLIDNVFKNLKPEGYFLVEVRNKQCTSECKNKMICNRELSIDELDNMILPKGYVRVKSIVNGIALAGLYQKKKI